MDSAHFKTDKGFEGEKERKGGGKRKGEGGNGKEEGKDLRKTKEIKRHIHKHTRHARKRKKMLAKELLEYIQEKSVECKGGEDKNKREPEWIAPKVDGESREVLNAREVTLHRGACAARFQKPDDPDGVVVDFVNPPVDGWVHPEPGRGISVNILGSNDDIEILHEAHRLVFNICRIHLGNLLDEIVVVDDHIHKVSRTSIKKLVSRKNSYLDILRVISEHRYEKIRTVPIPLCCVKTCKYEWARLISSPTSDNEHHYHLEVKNVVLETDLQSMATCSDGEWLPCTYFLRAASEQPNDDVEDDEDIFKDVKLDKSIVRSPVTVRVYYALRYLLDDFMKLRENIDINEVFEVCMWIVRIARGDIYFKHQNPTGIELYPRLAAFLEVADHTGYFWVARENYETIIHDVKLALDNSPINVRLVKCSLIALFDSGRSSKNGSDINKTRKHTDDHQTFHAVPAYVTNYLAKCLRLQNVANRCDEAWHEDLRTLSTTIDRQNVPTFALSWDPLVEEPSFTGTVKKSFAVKMADLLEKFPNALMVAAGSATIMIPNLPNDTLQDMEDFIRQSTDVQRAISFVIDRFLITKIGPLVFDSSTNDDTDNKMKIFPRASDFLTATRSLIDSPQLWYLNISPPSLSMPLSIGVIRVKTVQIPNVGKVGMELHNLVRTLNLAVWRIGKSHILWCLHKKSQLDLARVIKREGGSVTLEAATNWAKYVIQESTKNLDELGIRTLPDETTLGSGDPYADAYIMILTWDETLCKNAIMLCKNEGLTKVGISRLDYFYLTWTVHPEVSTK